MPVSIPTRKEPTKKPMQIIGSSEVMRRLNLKSRVTLWRYVRDEKFPPPIVISSRAHGWLESIVDEWFEAKQREQDRFLDESSNDDDDDGKD